MTDNLENHESVEDIPDKLIANLKTLFDTELTIPGEIDDTIIAGADRYLVKKRRFKALRWATPLAAAAGLVIILLSLYSRKDTAMLGDAESLVPAPDTVTILDAFTVARAIRAGEHGKEQWDVNHDGTVDRVDVNELIAAAVRL